MNAPKYDNGYIPDSLLITFKTGHTKGEGDWKHQLSRGTHRKHLRLVALAKKRTGRTLTIGPGWGAYRPFFSQEYARKKYGNGAAWPGTSSHGGFWEDKQTLAMDYDNWGWVYDWDRAAFYADARAAGLAPGLISRERGYPDEPWHVVDLDPWSNAGGNTDPEDDMTPEQDKLLKDIAAMLYAGGPSASKGSYLGAEGTIYRMLAQPVQRAVDGAVKRIPQIQDNADTNTLVRELLTRQAATDAAIKALAAGQGADPDAIAQIVETAVQNAMRGITFTVTSESDG